MLNKILHTGYLEGCGINEFEEIREKLRDLIKYIPKKKVIYETNFKDDILSLEWHESELENDDLKNYKDKVEFYIRQHQKDNPVIAKLNTNQPLDKNDVEQLEKILWNELGSREEYITQYGEKLLGEFVRELIGLDMTSAKEAFAQYLDSTDLDADQIYFVNQIVEYIVRNGVMKDLSVLQESPFTDNGSVADLFGYDLDIWAGIRSVIYEINSNAMFS